MRKCDGCTVCCTVLMVPELKKPMYETCKFCSKGCSIYKDRPSSCRKFECAWLKGDMSEEMKPNKAHFMVEHLPNDIPIVLAMPEKGHEKTWRTLETDKVLKETYQEKGISVVCVDGFGLLAEGHTPEFVKEKVLEAQKYLKV